ncbi:adenine deaminase C-terminal domain-containing protein [Erysipelothrix sp. P66]|uniref:adenine deaminase C-terminal domain-containing protein n=1 Tax=Erysipelothrix sp. P66 TaxID=3141531 RepID=UPI00315D0C7E
MITKFTGAFLYNTAQRQFEKGDFYIQDSMIYHIGEAKINSDHEINVEGKWIIPGLIDIHMHIESSMTNPNEFSNTVLPMGTTTLVADAHEIGNVFGTEGLIDFMDIDTNLDIFYAIPSSVPSTNPFLETTGGIIDESAIRTLCKHPKVIALGEIMNFKDVISDEDTMTRRIIETFKECKPGSPIEGHIPRITGLELSRFIQRGIGSDHTLQTPESILERTRMGVLVQMQEKSLSRETIATLCEYKLHGSFCLVTDDVMPDDLIHKGHMNHLIQLCIKYGMRAEDAIYAATLVPSQRMQLNDRGVLSPGKLADFIILDDLDAFAIQSVYKKGINVQNLEHEHFLFDDDSIFNTIKRNPITEADIVSSISKIKGDEATIRIMHREVTNTFTEEQIQSIPVREGVLQWQDAGLTMIAVIERYGHQTPIAIGFTDNGFTEKGAVATSWTHDHHNILVMGTDVQDMVNAVNHLIDKQGGIVSIINKNIHFVPLSYGGIVSTQSMESLALDVSQIRHDLRTLGYEAQNELMSFSVLGLIVSPSLKISDKGYVDVRTQEIKPLFINPNIT